VLLHTHFHCFWKLQLATAARAVAEEKQQQAGGALREARSALEAISKKMNDAALEKKNLDSNVRYRAARTEMEERQRDLAKKRAELHSAGPSEQLAALEKDQKELQTVLGKVERLRGHRDTLKAQKADLESKIKRAEPKKVQSDLVDKMVELEATRLAVKDMDEYHSALDKALMKLSDARNGSGCVFFPFFFLLAKKGITKKRWRKSTASSASCGRRPTKEPTLTPLPLWRTRNRPASARIGIA
jgi:chromosome segregation ATPase